MAARSKLKNFAPKILLCAGLIVLSIRNANIVSDSKASDRYSACITRQSCSTSLSKVSRFRARLFIVER